MAIVGGPFRKAVVGNDVRYGCTFRNKVPMGPYGSQILKNKNKKEHSTVGHLTEIQESTTSGKYLHTIPRVMLYRISYIYSERFMATW